MKARFLTLSLLSLGLLATRAQADDALQLVYFHLPKIEQPAAPAVQSESVFLSGYQKDGKFLNYVCGSKDGVVCRPEAEADGRCQGFNSSHAECKTMYAQAEKDYDAAYGPAQREFLKKQSEAAAKKKAVSEDLKTLLGRSYGGRYGNHDLDEILSGDQAGGRYWISPTWQAKQTLSANAHTQWITLILANVDRDISSSLRVSWFYPLQCYLAQDGGKSKMDGFVGLSIYPKPGGTSGDDAQDACGLSQKYSATSYVFDVPAGAGITATQASASFICRYIPASDPCGSEDARSRAAQASSPPAMHIDLGIDAQQDVAINPDDNGGGSVARKRRR